MVPVLDSDKEIFPAAAAKLLGVSRPYVNELLLVGAIPYRCVGKNRRIRVADLEAYRERTAQREAAMAQMAAIANASE